MICGPTARASPGVCVFLERLKWSHVSLAGGNADKEDHAMHAHKDSVHSADNSNGRKIVTLRRIE